MKSTITYPTTIRLATVDDISAINSIARQYNYELGYISNIMLQESINRSTLYVAEQDDKIVGFVNWYARKDGWSTIREIAVHKDYKGFGIGRMLLYSVPCPIRLKCPVDLASNDFYKHCGFKLVETVTGRKRPLNVWERKHLFIFCKGSSVPMKDIPHRTGMAYGNRNTEFPYYQPFFVDFNWKSYKKVDVNKKYKLWQEYLTHLSQWKPVMALVPDFESLDELTDVLTKIAELKALGIMRVGVCPKFEGAIQYLPKEVIICVSIPTSYAGFLPAKDELQGRLVHFLGGSPQKQWKWLQYYDNCRVISLDGNSHTKAAQRGTIYLEKLNKWKWSKHLNLDYLSYTEIIHLSSLNIVRKFQ